MISKERIFPNKKVTGVTTKPLSILDVGCIRYSDCAGVWFYHCQADKCMDVIEKLKLSLSETLQYYPNFYGQVSWIPIDLKGDLVSRSHRLQVTYGEDTDPGVEFIVKVLDTDMKDYTFMMSEDNKCWDASPFDFSILYSDTILNFYDFKEHPEYPTVSIQASIFANGGLSLSIKIFHVLADAQTMTTFMQNWSTLHKCFLQDQTLSLPTEPLFEPMLLEDRARIICQGDIPDSSFTPEPPSIPLNNYDLWASGTEDCPAPMKPTTVPIQELEGLIKYRNAICWDEWDISKPAGYLQLHFSKDTILKIWNLAKLNEEEYISKQDSLLGHIWLLINKARGRSNDTKEVSLNVTVGLRKRISPPLTSSFSGSPVSLIRVAMKGKDMLSQENPLPMVSRLIHNTLSLLTVEEASKIINDLRYEYGPYRLWQGNIGLRNTIVTSWVHLGIYNIDFGFGNPVYVHSIMPFVDGCIQVMESPPKENKDISKQWFDDGVSMAVYLKKETIDLLAKDPALFDPTNYKF